MPRATGCDARAPGGATPGTVLAVDGSGAVIAAGGGGVRAIRVRPDGAGKIAAQEAGLKQGEALGA